MSLWLVTALAAVGIFALGVLVGSGLVTRQQEQRDRRQAQTQRAINEVLRRQQSEPTEESDGQVSVHPVVGSKSGARLL